LLALFGRAPGESAEWVDAPPPGVLVVSLLVPVVGGGSEVGFPAPNCADCASLKRGGAAGGGIAVDESTVSSAFKLFAVEVRSSSGLGMLESAGLKEEEEGAGLIWGAVRSAIVP
jgi:hypothetical protein